MVDYFTIGGYDSKSDLFVVGGAQNCICHGMATRNSKMINLMIKNRISTVILVYVHRDEACPATRLA